MSEAITVLKRVKVALYEDDIVGFVRASNNPRELLCIADTALARLQAMGREEGRSGLPAVSPPTAGYFADLALKTVALFPEHLQLKPLAIAEVAKSNPAETRAVTALFAGGVEGFIREVVRQAKEHDNASPANVNQSSQPAAGVERLAVRLQTEDDHVDPEVVPSRRRPRGRKPHTT